jgi:hypothetical protein
VYLHAIQDIGIAVNKKKEKSLRRAQNSRLYLVAIGDEEISAHLTLLPGR